MSVQQIEHSGSGFDSNFVHDPSTGNTGIGTGSPSYPLHVVGVSRVDGYLVGVGGSGVEYMLTHDTGNSYINATGGKVGICTTTPSSTLEVNGTLGIDGAAALGSTLAVTGAATLSSTLGVSGNTTVGGSLAVSVDTSLAGGDSSQVVNSNIVKEEDGMYLEVTFAAPAPATPVPLPA